MWFSGFLPLFLLSSCYLSANPPRPISNLRVTSVPGPVTYFLRTQDVWIGSRGIFKSKLGSQDPEPENTSTGIIYDIEEDQNSIWFGGDGGLFVWQKGSSEPPQQAARILGIYAIYLDGKVLWIGTERSGLYRWVPGSEPVQVLSPFESSWINDVSGVDNTLWIAAASGVYRFDKNQPGPPKRLPLVTGQVFRVLGSGSTMWIAAENGLYRWDAGLSPLPVLVAPDTGWVADIKEDHDTLWFGTRNGLFRWDKTWQNRPPELYFAGVERVFKVEASSVDLWLGTDNAVYRLPRVGALKAEPQLENVGTISSIASSNNTTWIGTQDGLYRIDNSPTPWKAGISLSTPNRELFSGEQVTVRWQIHNFEWRVDSDHVQQRLIVSDLKTGKVLSDNAVDPGRFDFTIADLPAGNLGIAVEATDLFGHTTRSDQLSVMVRQSVWGQVATVTKDFGLIYAGLNIFAFAVLTFGARWSYRCFAILTDPTIQKLSLYFGFAVRTFTPITLWVFERYYAELKKSFCEDDPYLAGALMRPEGAEIRTADLFMELKNAHPGGRFWIYGASGTGKTALTRELMKQYASSITLRKAWKKHSFVPILVPLRDFQTGSGLEIIANALDASSIPLDLKLVEALLRTKKFLVVFDGLNEVATDREILEFASIYKSVSIVVTSQIPSSNNVFREYRLPPVTGAFAKQLLVTFLGTKAAVAFQGEPALWESMESGYDVRLVADLIMRKVTIPQTRIALYGAIADSALGFGLSAAGRTVMFKLAFTMWVTGQYRFTSESDLTAEMLTATLKANIAVRRGDQYEFRHDLMRGYLAARWLARDVLSPHALESRLSEIRIWDLDSVEQKTVFPFFVGLLPDENLLQEVFLVAQEHPEVRAELMIAVVQEGKKRGAQWSLKGHSQSSASTPR